MLSFALSSAVVMLGAPGLTTNSESPQGSPGFRVQGLGFRVNPKPSTLNPEP